MRIDIACFTARGLEVGQRLQRELAAQGETVRLDRCGAGGASVREWTKACFREADALVFIGAAGIAVRAIAPELVSKAEDPAVAVVDDAGQFAVSLLSGHIGGANALAKRLAGILGATAVITTSTDVNGVFAIDDWAARNGLAVRNPERIKFISSRLLAGNTATLQTAFPVLGPLPQGIALAEADGDVVIDFHLPDADNALHLVPPVLALGVGCRKGTEADAIEEAFRELCGLSRICPSAVGKVCSIDLKKQEPGLLAFCRRRGLPFETFAPEVLAKEKGEFSSSEFVKSVAGVDTVCERSAVAGSRGRLVAGKTVINGVALALAIGEFSVDFQTVPGDDA